MRSIGVVALLFVVATSLVAGAQCGCETGIEPGCYLVFKTNQTVEFSLVAPVEWFEFNGYTQSPQIFGWRIETWDGNVVRTVVFPGEPRSRLTVMEWDLLDESGIVVPPGYYNVIVMTTHSDVAYPIRVLEACRPLCLCTCNCYAPVICDIPCPPPCGELYLSLGVGEERACNGLTFTFSITIELEEVP